MNFFDKILSHLFKKYTYKIYKKGYVDGFNNERYKKQNFTKNIKDQL